MAMKIAEDKPYITIHDSDSEGKTLLQHSNEERRESFGRRMNSTLSKRPFPGISTSSKEIKKRKMATTTIKKSISSRNKESLSSTKRRSTPCGLSCSSSHRRKTRSMSSSSQQISNTASDICDRYRHRPFCVGNGDDSFGGDLQQESLSFQGSNINMPFAHESVTSTAATSSGREEEETPNFRWSVHVEIPYTFPNNDETLIGSSTDTTTTATGSSSANTTPTIVTER